MKRIEKLYQLMQENDFVVSKLGFGSADRLIELTGYSRTHTYRLLRNGKEGNRILDLVAVRIDPKGVELRFPDTTIYAEMNPSRKYTLNDIEISAEDWKRVHPDFDGSAASCVKVVMDKDSNEILAGKKILEEVLSAYCQDD